MYRVGTSIRPPALPQLVTVTACCGLCCSAVYMRGAILTHADDDCNSTRKRKRWVGKACLSWEGQSIPVSLTNELYFRLPFRSVVFKAGMEGGRRVLALVYSNFYSPPTTHCFPQTHCMRMQYRPKSNTQIAQKLDSDILLLISCIIGHTLY